MKKFLLMATLLAPTLAFAQLEWRLSVKFILDSNGNLPASGRINSPAIVTNQLVTINQNLDRLGRGYRLRLDEVVLVPGISQWFNYDFAKNNKSALEATAPANPTTYFWRTDAINVYICGTSGTNSGGLCSFPNTGQNIILVAQNSFSDVIIHEAGHFFSLQHTHQGELYQNQDGSTCSTNNCSCAVWIPAQGDSGRIQDTILDHQCYTNSSNQVAIANYGMPYPSLQPFQQKLVLNTWLNIMSYHSPGRLFTDDQLDAMTDASNDSGQRFNVATGRTWFVDRQNGCLQPAGGSGCTSFGFGGPLLSVASGINAAAPGDIVLIRPGNYNEQPTIYKRVTLRATRGSVTIGKP